jgi:uncharacterized OB-fold protein
MNTLFRQLFGTSSATASTGSSAPADPAYQPSSAPWWASESNTNAPTPSLHVFDPHGHAVELADSSGRGGEALIHPVAARPEVLVKLYHPEVRARAERTQALRRKLAAMTRLTALHKDSRYAWPRFEVFDDQRRWLGFAMARVQGRPLTFLLAPALLRQELPHWDGRYLVAVAGNLAKHLDFLASQGVIVGDINPGNFLFDPATGKACWYPREDGTAYEWREVAGNATLYSFSVVRGPINPLFEPTYAPGLVELDAVPGVRLVTQIVDCEFDAIHCGMPLELCFRELHPRGHAAFIAPVFRPRS